MKKKMKEIIEENGYEFVFIYLWVVTSTLLCFGSMLFCFVATFTIEWKFLIFYPVMGVVIFILYLFGFVYVKLGRTDKNIEGE